MADRIVREVAKPYDILGHKVEIGTSVGVALFPADSADEAELLADADLALYAVKKSGRNAFSLFFPTMRKGVEHKHDDAAALLTAIESGQLELYYQPIVDARTGALRELESFVRWQHPEKGLLTAEQFMPLSEQLHLAQDIGQWVLDSAFRQHKRWRSMGLPTVPITVNISTTQFSSLNLLEQIRSLATQHDTGWEWLRLDIKEEAVLNDVTQAIRKIGVLRDGGIATRLDNFGRGFISLGFMSQLPFLGIKFNSTALRLDGESNVDVSILGVLKGIAQIMNAKLTATHIESDTVAKWMCSQNVDLMQGYHIAAPASSDHATEWLRTSFKHER